MWLGALGDDTDFSRALFRRTLLHDRAHELNTFYLLKHLVTSQRNAVASALWHTNYEKVLRDVKMTKAATMSYLIDASNEHVKSGFGSLASGQQLTTLKDRLYNPNHKILVETHVYCFYYAPSVNEVMLGLQFAVALIQLGVAVGAAVTTFGGASPAILAALRSMADVVSDVIKLAHEAQKAKDDFMKLKGAVMGVVGAASDVRALHDARSEADRRAASGAFQMGALGGTASRSSGDAASGIRMDAMDFASGRVKVEQQTTKGYVWDTTETVQEAIKRTAGQIAAEHAEWSKLMFAVVQQATPVVLVREDLDVRGSDIICNLKLHACRRSLLRIGHSNLPKYQAMVTSLGFGHSEAELLINPWLVENRTGYAQYLRYPEQSADAVRRFDANESRLVDWNANNPTDWELYAEVPGHSLPLPQQIRDAALSIQSRRAQFRTDSRERINDRLRLAGRAAQTELAARAASNATAHANVLSLLIRHPLPKKADFVKATEIQYGPFTARRTNPLLLSVDMMLDAWHQETSKARAGGDVLETIMANGELLMALEDSCEKYIREKSAKVAGGHEVQRLRPVQDLQGKARALREGIAGVAGTIRQPGPRRG